MRMAGAQEMVAQKMPTAAAAAVVAVPSNRALLSQATMREARRLERWAR